MATTPLRSRLLYSAMIAGSRIRLAEPELQGLCHLVRPGDAVIDVGAAYGMYTFPLAHIVGSTGRVLSFEPQPRQNSVLGAMRRFLAAGHVAVAQAVLGHEAGTHTMQLPVKFGLPIHGHAHVATNGAATLAGARRWETAMHTVDDFCASAGVETVSFIKVDVEGFEPSVLAGATATIERDRPSMLLEIEDRHLSRYGRDANQFADEIRTRWPDYDMYTWSNGCWNRTERVALGVRNYLFATEAAFARVAAPAPAAGSITVG